MEASNASGQNISHICLSDLVEKFLGVFILFSLKKLLNSFNAGLLFSLFKKDKDFLLSKFFS